MEPSLSVIIITKNSAKTIEKCLDSVKWADEIVILDSGSTDSTMLLCEKYTSRLFQTDWPGFGPQKNRAIDHATRDWIFSIDSDEWVTEISRDEIIRTIAQPIAMVYVMPRRNQYCGQWIRYGDVGRDKVIRLFKRGTAKFNNNIVHENIVANEKIGRLKNPLMHNSYASLEDLLQRMNYYTTLSAQSRFKQGKKTSLNKAIFSAIWAFLKSYFFRLGFLDRKMGFVVAVSSAESSYYRHMKLMELWDGISCQ